jgi:2-keto-4-pentenoate hydratase
MNATIERAAELLLAHRRAGKPAGPLPAELAPSTEDEGAAVQLALARLMAAFPPAGFKIGATAARMQAYLGLSGPAGGFMPQAGIHASGVVLPWSAFRGPGVECEIGVRLARDLPPGAYDAAQAAAAVETAFAAIEVVDNRYGTPPAGDLKALGTPTLIADQVYHAAAVLGAPAEGWRTLDLAAVTGRISVDGVLRAEGKGADLLGHPMAALAWLAGSGVARVFGGLRAGQVVMLGSVTPPIWLDGPGTAEVEFDGLGPVVSVRFI